jgi:hypothetical protein
MKYYDLKFYRYVDLRYVCILLFLLILFVTVSFAEIVRIPEDYLTIQSGIDAAISGDTVLIYPSIYHENLNFDGKAIVSASRFYSTGEEEYIEQTIIDGDGGSVVVIGAGAGGTQVIGLTIQNGDKGIQFYSEVDTFNNYVHNNTDGISYESASGTCKNNLITNNRDDGIDIDGSSAAVIENNTIKDNDDDGIENRLHPYSGDPLEITIRDNLIANNKEDGIQLIDYPDVSDRRISIERNRIINNEMVGIGIMPDGNSNEDFSGAPMPERVLLINNTFVGNYYGVTGGINLIALNNIFSETTIIALKNVTGDSVVSHSIFWDNDVDYEQSNIELADSFFSDPELMPDYSLSQDSIAIDEGVTYFEWLGEIVLDMPESSYTGLSVDVGAVEYEGPFGGGSGNSGKGSGGGGGCFLMALSASS